MKVSQPSSYSQCSICAGRANAFVSANRWNRQWVDFAHTFWHVDCVRKQSYNAFSERYQKWCKRHGYFFKQSNAEEVYALAKNAVVLAPKSGVTKVLVQESSYRKLQTSSPAPHVLSRLTAQKWNVLRPCCRSTLSLWRCTVSESPSALSSWLRSAMCSVLNESNLWLPLQVLIPCPISPVTRMSGAINPPSVARHISAKHCSM